MTEPKAGRGGTGRDDGSAGSCGAAEGGQGSPHGSEAGRPIPAGGVRGRSSPAGAGVGGGLSSLAALSELVGAPPGHAQQPADSTHREGTNPNRQLPRLVLSVRLVDSRRICPAQVGCVVDPVGSRRARRIVWMINGMNKRASRLAEPSRVEHKIQNLVVDRSGHKVSR